MSPALTNGLIALAALLVLADLGVARQVVRSTSFSRHQKLAQLVLVFALPVLGCGLVWAVLSEDGRARPGRSTREDDDVGSDTWPPAPRGHDFD